MSDQVEQALAEVPLRVENPELIPAARYYDPAFFELEKDRLWSRVWQMACRLEEIPEVGDYTEYTIFEKSVILVRTPGGIKAFHNVCRHRGMRLVDGPGHCGAKGLVCPFHGWRYGLDGANTFVFGKGIFSEELLAHAEIDLKPCRVETWGGCAFITFDDAAPPLREALGPVVEKLEFRNAEQLRTEWWRASVVPVNWKVAVEAFVEMYHLMRTHPELHGKTPSAFAAMDPTGISANRRSTGAEVADEVADYLTTLREGMGGLVHAREMALIDGLRGMELPADAGEATALLYARIHEEIERDGRTRGLPIFDLDRAAAEHPSFSNELMFPNFFLLPLFGCMASYRIRPLTPESCLFEIWSLILVPQGEPYESPRQPTVLPHDSADYPEIVRQDYYNMPLQQQGLHSGEIEFQRLSKMHEGAISNFERLIDGYLAGLDHALLTKGAHAVNGGSFMPIRDIGF